MQVSVKLALGADNVVVYVVERCHRAPEGAWKVGEGMKESPSDGNAYENSSQRKAEQTQARLDGHAGVSLVEEPSMRSILLRPSIKLLIQNGSP